MRNSDDRIAITGLGCVSAAGDSLAATLASIDAGERRFSPSPFAGVAPGSPVFVCEAALPGPETLSRTARLALAAANEALAQAGLEPSFGMGRVAVCLGTSVGASLHFREYYAAWRSGNEAYPLESVTMYRESNPSLAVASFYGFDGPMQTIANACSSGADAIGLAASWLRMGLCDVAVAGGADALSEITYTGFSRLMLASPEACRPFDASRSGLNLGEGAGVMVLERLCHAKERGKVPLGYMEGYGTATDSYHLTSPHPEAAGLKKAYAQAFAEHGERGGEHRTNLAFVNAHGTGTKTNDAAEGAFFAGFLPGVPFVATKGATGHTLGAAGGVEAVLTLAHLRRGLIPASPGFLSPDPAIPSAPVSAPTPVVGRFAASQSLAFGGNNSVLVFSAGESTYGEGA
ncbi:MAG: 3-oxoacyl-[acyl-carrier-protein] synthase 2 [Desulfovibrio sp.]